jgi:uncharacterized membrane protein YczE
LLLTKTEIYLSGCAIFSTGATLFILSHLGADPLDVLSVGVKNTFGLLIGTTQSLFTVMYLVIWSGHNSLFVGSGLAYPVHYPTSFQTCYS